MGLGIKYNCLNYKVWKFLKYQYMFKDIINILENFSRWACNPLLFSFEFKSYGFKAKQGICCCCILIYLAFDNYEFSGKKTILSLYHQRVILTLIFIFGYGDSIY